MKIDPLDTLEATTNRISEIHRIHLLDPNRSEWSITNRLLYHGFMGLLNAVLAVVATLLENHSENQIKLEQVRSAIVNQGKN